MSGRNRNRRGGRIWITVLVAVAVLGVAAYGVMAALKSSPQIDPASLVEVERGDIARSVVATGKIEPRSKVEVKSKASGIVKKLYVDYGDWVKQGQLLVELDKEELQARLREA
jgi:HlyD family secretion protein